MAPPATSKETVLVERLASPKGSHSEWNKQTPINYSNENKDPRPGVSTVHPAFSSTELQDIDDFERLHPYIPKATPAPVLKPTLASDPGRLVPIARVTKGNSNNVVKIHHLCDQRGLVPYFDCSGDPLAGGFIGKVEFGDQSVETTDLWPNKKAAKEAAAELAVERFEAVKEQLVGMKRKKVAGGPGDEDRGVSVDRSENWIALLNEYTQRNRIDFAEYQEYTTEGLPLLFGATVRFTGSPEPRFGVTLGPFSSKGNAKIAAAKEAVTWLRDGGLLRDTSVKRVRLNSSDPLDPPTTAPNVTPPAQSPVIDLEAEATMPATTRLHHLAFSLGLLQPRFDCHPSPRNPEDPPAVPFYDAATLFDPRDVASETRLAGPVGKVKRVLGQKRAKTACYQRTIDVLEDLRRERERAQKV